MSNTCPVELPGIEPIRQIGAGGFGEVWLANQTNFDRRVALKIAHRPFTNADDSRRFERECMALGRLTGHPNIIDVHLSGFQNELPYIVMEYVEGGTLADHGRSMTEAELRTVACQLCNAVSAAHQLGVLHRDLKPENVFLRADRSAVLGDFGIARLGDGNITEAGQVTATIAFAAPEILNGQPASVAADIYGIGVTLAAAIMGRSPFRQDDMVSMEAIMARVFEGLPPDLTAYGMSPAFSGLIQMTMARDAEHRPTSADDLLARINALPPVGGGENQQTNQQWIQPNLQHGTPSQPIAYQHHQAAHSGNGYASGQPVFGGAAGPGASGSNSDLLAALGVLGLVAVVGLGVIAFTNRSDDSADQPAEGGESAQAETEGESTDDDQRESQTPDGDQGTDGDGSGQPAPEPTVGEETTTTPPSTVTPALPLLIPISSSEVSALADIPIDAAGWDEISGPANSPQFCDERPDITGLIETTAALYPIDPVADGSLRQVVIRMHRFASPDEASSFVESYTTLTCESWNSTEYTSDGGVTVLTARLTQPVNDYADETRQVDQEALLPNGFNLLSRTLLVRSGTDVMKLVFQTGDPADLDPLTDAVASRAVESLGYSE